MKLPKKIVLAIKQEAVKYADFRWYQAWEGESGYIRSTLDCERDSYCRVRLYIPWKKSKSPTNKEIKATVESEIDRLIAGGGARDTLRSFKHFVSTKYFVDVARLKSQVVISVTEHLDQLIKALQSSSDFESMAIQELYDDLKNLETGISDYEAINLEEK